MSRRDAEEEQPATTRRTIDGLLEEARSRLVRLGPAQALAAQAAGALLVDIRGDDQRREHGCIPGAIVIPRNVLEWRADPACADCDPRIARLDAHIVIVCQQGYQSSLAAGTLQELGFRRATDLDGGFEAWRAAGLPIERALVEVLTFEGCPHGPDAFELARRVVAEAGRAAEVQLVYVTREQADAQRFLGSPSIRVGGRDVDPAADARRDYGFSCRLYATPGGLRPLPPEVWVRDALGASDTARQSNLDDVRSSS